MSIRGRTARLIKTVTERQCGYNDVVSGQCLLTSDRLRVQTGKQTMDEACPYAVRIARSSCDRVRVLTDNIPVDQPNERLCTLTNTLVGKAAEILRWLEYHIADIIRGTTPLEDRTADQKDALLFSLNPLHHFVGILC